MIMKSFRLCLVALCLGLLARAVQATTVIPPSFDQLVREAELIFEGTVIATESQWLGEGAERVIVTYVTFDIQDALKHHPNKQYTIRMLGGTVGGETAEVTDAPRFKLGDHDILFVEHNGSQFIPLVGIMHGRFHIQEDAAGHGIVTKESGAGVAHLDKLGTDEIAAVSGRSLSVDEFKAAVRQKLLDLGLAR
jgi:hypothetical protein